MTYLDNPTYTYRGFRLQALYIVYKIFTSSNSYTFQPEGIEDLAIYKDRILIKVIQVKSGDNDLVISNFKNFFFERLVSTQSMNPNIDIQIVKFGPIGIELKKAYIEDGVSRQKTINKLLKRENLKCTRNQLELLFNSIKIIEVSEENIHQKLNDVLKDSLLGINIEHAYDLLINWIYHASEKQKFITQKILKEKIVNIGKFLKSREVYHKKWFSIIQPLELLSINEKQRDFLSQSYYQGESAKLSHIQLNLDVKRLNKLQIIQKLHSEKNILFIHGASGQGKSTLAYRYIHDFYPESWCFEIKLTESRADALETALAISEYANNLDTFILVYMDISPYDSGWEELVKSLSNFSNIKVLITLREEDWKKSNISGIEFSFNEIELKFNENEAHEIFQVLFEKQSIKHYLNFTDAWNTFGNQGSLLEFVYLLTQGGRIKERLQSQVNKLIDENNNSIISILRCIAVATASGARLSVRKTINHFQISPELLFKRLESEYFLRMDDSKQWIEAYHPLRSIILEEILLDNIYAPWIEQFQIVWNLVHEEDIDIFLFHAFLNHFNLKEEIFSTILASNLNNWIAIEKIIKVLIWLSIKAYVEDNLEYIKNIFNTVEGHFLITIGSNIMNLAKESIIEIINSPIIPEERRIKYWEIYEYLGLDNFKPKYLIKYLEKLPKNTPIPTNDKEWHCISKTMLWLMKYNMIERTSFIDKNSLGNCKIKSTQIASHFTTTLYLTYPKLYKKWQILNRKTILEELCKEENIIGIEETSENIKAHFLTFDLANTDNNKYHSDDENIIHTKTLSVVDILHKLFPEKKIISTQGYGHHFPLIQEYDESVKNIPIENLFIEEFVRVNAMFRRIINNQFRPRNWNEYIESVITLRKQILEYLNLTIRLVSQFFLSKTPINPLHCKSFILEEWNKIDLVLRKQILLPVTVADTWGFSDEETNVKKDFNEINYINLSTKKYSTIQKVIRDYKTNLGIFHSQSVSVFDINSVVGKLKYEERNEIIQLLESKNIPINNLHFSWINLLDSIKSLFILQKEFDNIFSEIFDYKLNSDLKIKEISAANKLVQLWYFFIHNSNIKTKQPQIDLSQRFEEKKKNLLKEILSLLNKNEMETKFLIIEIYNNEEKNSIIRIRAENKLAINSWYSCFEAIIKISEYIHNLTPFGKTVLEWNWKEILFIPTTNNYTINNFIIPMPTNHYLLAKNGESLNPIQHIFQKLTAIECELIGLSTFSSYIIDSINEIFDLTSKLFLYVSNLKNLNNLPDNLDYGEDVLINYVKKINLLIDNTINPIINKLSILQNYIKENIEDENDICTQFLSELSNFWIHLYPDSIFDNKSELNMNELRIWSNELELAIESLMLFYPLAINLK